MFAQDVPIYRLARWVVFMAASVSGISACTDAPGQSASIPHAASTLPPAPVAIALGPINAFEFDQPRSLLGPGTAPQFSVIDLTGIGQPNHLVRARAPVGTRQTNGAALMNTATIVANVPNNAPTPDFTPWPTVRPDDKQHILTGDALCGGQPIAVHPNGGGLRAASLILHDDVYLPAGSILCGSGHISGWHQLNAH